MKNKRVNKGVPRSVGKRSQEKGFYCQNCLREVSLVAWGTKNRNHCPVCLWSRHVDNETGDRASRCQGGMEPIGLTTKFDKEEIMLVHRCLECGKINKNRIAGDDDEKEILAVLKKSYQLPETVKSELGQLNIELYQDEKSIREHLYGIGSQ